MNPEQPWSIYLISFAAFIAALALVEGLYLLWRGVNIEKTVRVNRRLRAMSAAGVSHSQAVSVLRERVFSDTPWLNRLLLSIPRLHTVDRLIEQSGVDMTVSRYLLIQVLMSLLAMVLLLLLTPGNLLVIVPVGLLAGFSAPGIYLQMKRSRRLESFSRQLPDTLDYIARSMRAGNPFTASMRSAAEELPEPMSSELRTTFEELNFGLDLEEALHNLGERVGSEDLRYFIAAVLIQRTTGGNLAEVLNRIAKVMRSRETTLREIRILAAEMKYSANVLIGLPFVVAGALAILNPGYLSVLFEHELGLVVIGLQLFLMAIGYYVIQKMINFRV